MKKYIVWDFDGTIANTNNIIIASWQATFRRYLGHEMPVKDIEATFGETLMHTIEELIPDAELDEVVDFYRDFQDSHHGKIDVYVFDGVRELLEELRARGCIIGVGTSRTTYSLKNYMRELEIEDLIDVIVTMNDVTSHKPDPETVEAVLLKMLELEESENMQSAEGACELSAECDAKEEEREDSAGAKRRKYAAAERKESADTERAAAKITDEVRAAAVMIGDTKYDIGCANNAGIDSVLIGWSHYVDEASMAADGYEPTYRIKTPKELLTVV